MTVCELITEYQRDATDRLFVKTLHNGEEICYNFDDSVASLTSPTATGRLLMKTICIIESSRNTEVWELCAMSSTRSAQALPFA